MKLVSIVSMVSVGYPDTVVWIWFISSPVFTDFLSAVIRKLVDNRMATAVFGVSKSRFKYRCFRIL